MLFSPATYKYTHAWKRPITFVGNANAFRYKMSIEGRSSPEARLQIRNYIYVYVESNI